jgi:hypothetical protein
LPLETCDTIAANGIWGYTKAHDVRTLQVRGLRSLGGGGGRSVVTPCWGAQDLVHTMIEAAGRGGNYLLNLGPGPGPGHPFPG